MTPQPRYRPGDRIGGRYQVHKALLGGMGEVYLCLDLETNYPYALKTFQQRYLTDAQRLRKAFEQEVATWVALEKHPNIVRCFWMQLLDNQPFMCLEWIAGEEDRGTDLRGWLRRGPIELKLALQIAIDICHGLRHAQTKRPGLVHRDLKPENILMAQGGLAKITDFGLAELAQSAGLMLDLPASTGDGRHSLVGGQGIAGTPTYMAPEQWRGEALDERTDIYAVGVIVYELLTGQPPFAAVLPSTTPQNVQTWLQTLQHAHEQAQVTPLPSVLPAALNTLVQHCLAKTPAARYPTIAELLTRLIELYQAHFDHAPPLRPTPDAFTGVDYTNRGVTYHVLRDYAAALADYTRAIELDPNYATAYSNRGITLHALREDAVALADFTRAIELDPNYATAYSNRGRIYAALGERAAALADFTRALELDPNDAKAYYNRGVTYADLSEDAAALADYTRALELDPNLAQAYYNRGITYHALSKPATALADFTRALELDPNDAKAYTNRGLIYADLSEDAAALADYTRAIELDPNYATAYYNRGITYHALRDYAVALADYTRAIELDPNYATAYSNRGITLHALREDAVALADFTRAIELDPNYATAYTNRGHIYAALGERAAALADFTRALELDPNDAKAYYNRGVTYADLSEDAAALADYTRALELDPNDAKAYLNIGVLLYNQGEFADAVAYFEQAAHLGDSQGTAYATHARQGAEQAAEPPLDPAEEQALIAFVEADTPMALQQAVLDFPMLAQADFIAMIEAVIDEEMDPEDRPVLTQQLVWLRQLTAQPK